jgi:hypothetical protein
MMTLAAPQAGWLKWLAGPRIVLLFSGVEADIMQAVCAASPALKVGGARVARKQVRRGARIAAAVGLSPL